MEDESLDIRAYLHILRRWWWILVLGLTSTALVAFFVSNSMTPIYDAAVRILVRGGQTPGAPSLTEIQASQQLARSYGDLIKTRPILEKVIEQLSLPYGPGRLLGKIDISSPRSLIEIKASDPDPRLAAQIANTTAQVFIDDFFVRQFAHIAQFQSSLSQYGITQEPAIIAAQASTLTTLIIVEEALPPASPSRPQTPLNVIIGSMLGLFVAGFVVFLLEQMDNRIKSLEELNALTGMPNLGSVQYQSPKEGAGPIIAAEEHRQSALTESFKFLRTNLEFAALDTGGVKTLLVTSSTPGEGKTTTAANLATSLAKEGESVVLVDADLRRPNLHRVLGISRDKGLTNLLLGNASVEEVLVQTQVASLGFIPSGPLPPDAPQVLRSGRMKEVLEELKESSQIVIFDSSPLLSVTDPMLLAALVDATILVLDAHRTGRETVKRGAEVLRQANPALVGTVQNKLSAKHRSYYNDYYYYYYPSQDGSVPPDGEKPGLLSRILGNGTAHEGRRTNGLVGRVLSRVRGTDKGT